MTPVVTIHATLRYLERICGFADDVRRIRQEIAAERGVRVESVGDLDVLRRLQAENPRMDVRQVSDAILTEERKAAIRAGATAIVVDGVRFSVAPNGAITTAYTISGSHKAGHPSNQRARYSKRKCRT